jgi:hypothetical protein
VVWHDRLKLTQGHGGPQNPEVIFTVANIQQELPDLLIERAECMLRPVSVDRRALNAINALVRAKRPGDDGNVPA